MKRICFVCLGNICRSPMAEYMMKDLLKKEGLENEYEVTSRALSSEEYGNDIHLGTKNILNRYHIPYDHHFAMPLKQDDFNSYDYFVGMENCHVDRMIILFQTDEKIFRLLDFTNEEKDICDPWYTGNFDETYLDIKNGLDGFLKFLEKERK